MDVSSATSTPPLTISTTTTPNDKKEAELLAQETQAEQHEIQQLKTLDRVVRAHEAAHISAGGSLIRGSAHFSFQRGPDGVQYAIGGEVQIDTSKIKGNPQATLRKAERIRAAALAPAQPSPQDQAVASRAAQLAVEARAEINQQQRNTNKAAEQNSSTPSLTPPEEATGNLLDFTV